MATVFNTLKDPAGNLLTSTRVRIRLIAASLSQGGFDVADEETIVSEKTIRTDSLGRWSAVLEPNANIDPANTYYRIHELVPGQSSPVAHTISVPVGAGPYWVYDILITPPASLDPLHETSTTNVHGIVDTADLATLSGDETFTGDKIFTGALEIPEYTKAGLPAASAAGHLARVTDSTRGVWMDTGSQWFSLSGEVINVKEFGAKGDGVTDDTTAVLAAAAATPDRGTLLLPPGIYNISQGFHIERTNGMTVWGYGATLALQSPFTFIDGSDFGQPNQHYVLRHIQASRTKIIGLSITYPAASAALTTPVGATLMSVIGSNGNLWMDNVIVTGVRGSALGIAALTVQGGGAYIEAIHSVFGGDCDYGVRMVAGGIQRFIDCYMGNNLLSNVYKDSNVGSMVFTDCVIDECPQLGNTSIVIDASTNPATGTNERLFQGCTIYAAGGARAISNAFAGLVIMGGSITSYSSPTGTLPLIDCLTGGSITLIAVKPIDPKLDTRPFWNASGPITAIACSFGTGANTTGAVPAWGIYQSATGGLSVSLSPLTAAAKMVLRHDGVRVTDSSGNEKWSTRYDTGANRWYVEETGIARRFEIEPTTGKLRISDSSAATVGAAGAASALPATPTGYLIINIGGTDRKIPFYAT